MLLSEEFERQQEELTLTLEAFGIQDIELPEADSLEIEQEIQRQLARKPQGAEARTLRRNVLDRNSGRARPN